MDLRHDIINMLDQLSEDQLQRVIACIREIYLREENAKELQLDEEQQELMDLLAHTVDTGRGDFAEKHNRYLYDRDKQ